MKHAKLTIGLCLLSANALWGQAFDSGSTGSNGVLDVTNNMTLDMPSDGVFNFTTIRVRSGTTLYFRTNGLNTPVYLLAQADVLIENGGSINVDGGSASGSIPAIGGPGGFGGGFGAFQVYPDGDGLGPGAGTTANGYKAVSAFAAGSNTNVYGNTLCVPLLGGSGGAGRNGYGGGGGGGAILIASSTRISFGNNGGGIYARGSSGANGNPGSGGSIRLVAPRVDGGGVLDVSSVAGDPNQYGRVRIDTLDRLAWRNLVLTGKATVGTRMLTGLPDNQHLDVVEAAGSIIPLGTTDRVSINLPVGSPTNQLVKIRANGFTNDVPITLAVIPENGTSVRYTSVITANGANPVTNTVNVVIPVDTITYIQVWSK